MTILKYYDELKNIIDRVRVCDNTGKVIKFAPGAGKAVRMILKQDSKGKKLIFIGNGASASISSHQAADYSKNGGVRATAFNDAALLTCFSNDLGYHNVFKKAVELFAEKGDILIAISSSGRSENILNAAAAAGKKGCKIITLSGFRPDNPLSRRGDINFYVPSGRYSHVEIIHHSICHYMLELVMEAKNA